VTIAQKRIAQKHETYVQATGGGAETVEVPPEKVGQATLADKHIQELCRTVCRIEEHYGCHQDIEWAFEKGNLYILQARKAKTGAN
jgi:phosphoenolpyruvate synthase/pyruvate phosphate dikinase